MYNIVEAREQLERIEEQVKGKKRISEIDLQIELEHAYHHLNFAWNVRHTPTRKYANLSDEDFNRWSRFPKEMEVYKVESRRRSKPKDRIESKARETRDSASRKRV